MATSLLLIGAFLLGGIISYLIFSLLNKSNFVHKKSFDDVNKNFQELNTQKQIIQEKYDSQKEEIIILGTKLEIKENENRNLFAQVSAHESKISSDSERILGLTKQLSEVSTNNSNFQIEVNSLKEKVAEDTALINSQKETIITLKESNENLSNEVKKTLEDSSKLNNEKSVIEENYNTLQQSYAELKKVNESQSTTIESLNKQNTQIRSDNSTYVANNKALIEKLETQKAEILELQKTSQLQFEKIANEILEKKAANFTETNKSNIEALLKPLGENINNFKKQVEETYDKESKQRFSLEEKVKELVEQTNKVSSEANNLATALKGQAKKQGNWGELILESILEKSGLVKNREYFLQESIQDDEGKTLRPDVLIKLPDERIIIVDSKVSLVAYDRFAASESIEEQATHLADHLKSVYAHIDSLHNKQYDNLEKSLDFTMMFIPIEPAYLLSIQSDTDLWGYAYSKRILLISPTNLIACLKLMSDLWKREMQSKNAKDIVKRGELLYEKFVTFATSLEDIGKYIKRTQQSYDTAMNQFNSGRGHLVGQAMQLKNLGLKSSKEIPLSILPNDIDTEEIVPIDNLNNEIGSN